MLSTNKKPRPNGPCPCGSGKKFKKCHGAHSVVAAQYKKVVPTAEDMLVRGRNLVSLGQLEQAEICIQEAIRLFPNSAEAWLVLGDIAERADDFEVAKQCYVHLVKLHPENAQGHFLLGNAYVRSLAFESARKAYRRAVALQEDLSGAWGNLGNVEKYLGNFHEAVACYRRSIELETNFSRRIRLHSNLLFALHYDESLSHDEIYKAHVEWAECYARPLYPSNPVWTNSQLPERQLKIGYVSGSLNGLILGHLIESVLASHDRDAFQVFLYSSTKTEDATSVRLRGLCHEWVNIAHLSDDLAAKRIRDEFVDILIDLDGHSPTGRPLLFAHRPAPVQAEWLDYFDTTGMEAINYLLTDPYTTPENSPQRFAETPIRLPHTRFCYTPPSYAPPVEASPCSSGKPFTYGSFNRQDKLHPELINIWAEILLAVPGSRLLLKNRAIEIPFVRSALQESFAKQGVAPDRLILRGPSSHAEMLAEYGEVDVALDTFPYNGGLTSCECLWMGVPIVALEAERMIGRQTSAILRLLVLDDWVADTRADYVDLAVEKSRDCGDLVKLRMTLRERMKQTSLCNAPRFTRDLEAAYRAMWRQYCNTK
jgi:protein O-GlcNAc transferase